MLASNSKDGYKSVTYFKICAVLIVVSGGWYSGTIYYASIPFWHTDSSLGCATSDPALC